jgi:hypothetical protein
VWELWAGFICIPVHGRMSNSMGLAHSGIRSEGKNGANDLRFEVGGRDVPGLPFLPTWSAETSHRTPHGQAAVSWAAAHKVLFFFSLFCFSILNLHIFLENQNNF